MGSGKELGRREWGNVPRNRGNWGMAEWWKGTEGGDLGERKVPKGGTPGRERDRTRKGLDLLEGTWGNEGRVKATRG